MQTPTQTPHGILEYVPYAITSLLAIGGSALGYLFGRRQSNANVRKTEAEARRIDAETLQTQSAVMVNLIKEAGIQALQAERMREERNHWEQKAGVWEERCKILEKQMDGRVRVNPQLEPFEGD